MRFATVCAAASVVAVALIPPPLLAQSASGPQGVRVELSFVHASFDASDARDVLEGARSFDLGVAFHLDPHFMLVGGVQSTHHARADSATDGPDPVVHSRATVTQLYAEPRFVVINSGRVQPYVFLRLAYVRSSQTLNTTGDTSGGLSDITTQDGSGLGGGAGVVVNVWRNVNAQASAAWQKISLGNLYFSGNSDPDTGLNGTSIVIRVGASMDFGGASNALKTLRGR